MLGVVCASVITLMKSQCCACSHRSCHQSQILCSIRLSLEVFPPLQNAFNPDHISILDQSHALILSTQLLANLQQCPSDTLMVLVMRLAMSARRSSIVAYAGVPVDDAVD